jgi:hypothetical protein
LFSNFEILANFSKISQINSKTQFSKIFPFVLLKKPQNLWKTKSLTDNEVESKIWKLARTWNKEPKSSKLKQCPRHIEIEIFIKEFFFTKACTGNRGKDGKTDIRNRSLSTARRGTSFLSDSLYPSLAFQKDFVAVVV